MSLKAELETWAAALKAYDEEDFDKSLDMFSRIADSSKILVNMGLIYATLGEHEAAVEQFNLACQLDNYLAIGYFQCGVSNFLIGRYELALKDFSDAYLYMRGNQDINYEQLGLKHKLHSAEILFNRGLSLIYMQRLDEGLRDMEMARQDKLVPEHDVIDDAIRERGDGYTVFSVPVGTLYRPPENKLKNARAKDYMGKARLVAASDASDAYTTFTGVTRLQIEQAQNSGAGGGVTRSLSAGASPVSREPVEMAGADLTRNKTTINVVDRSRYDSPTSPIRDPALQPVTNPTPLSRAGTFNRAGVGAGNGGGLPTRGASLRRNPSTTSPPRLPESPPMLPTPVPPAKGGRETEFFDDYLDAYNEPTPPMPPMPAPPPPPPQGSERVADWARNNANPATRSGTNTPSRAPSAAMSYAPSSYSGGIRRKLTRRSTTRTRTPIQYEEEEGYVSGELDSVEFELSKIRIRLHRSSETRGMAISADMLFSEFCDRVREKFELNGRLALQFTDEDGGRVTLKDESDWDLAIETARESARGRPEGKLDVWCDG